jgi:hypothetical protein
MIAIFPKNKGPATTAQQIQIQMSYTRVHICHSLTTHNMKIQSSEMISQANENN